MGTMDMYTLTTEQMEECLTQAKCVFVEYLLNDGYIDKETAEKLIFDTAILLRKPNFFSVSWNKYFRKGDKTKPHYVVVEQKTLDKSIQEYDV